MKELAAIGITMIVVTHEMGCSRMVQIGEYLWMKDIMEKQIGGLSRVRGQRYHPRLKIITTIGTSPVL
jgi:ABC-type polar amino acid transport system ATPase subunit